MSIQFSCFLLSMFAVAVAAADIQYSPTISTKSGPVRGKLLQFEIGQTGEIVEVYAFAGIPFAAPPIGERRYKKPAPVEPWGDTVLDVINDPPSCVQVEGRAFSTSEKIVGSEDCLYLNIWVPKSALDEIVDDSSDSRLSTFVFIHGGAFIGGSVEKYNGSLLAGYNNIVVAAIQYRLGSLGFAYFGGDSEEMSGNMALWDQLEAIKWISENIDAFGGNSSQITIGGQSAGAVSVSLHLLSPHSRGYFHGAIIQSGTALSPWAVHSPQQAIRVTDMMFQQVASKVCNQTGTISVKSPVSNKVKCLKAIDASIFPRADRAPMLAGFGIPFTPVIDGDFLPENPLDMLAAGNYSEVPLLIGANKDEGSDYLIMAPEAAMFLPTPDKPNLKMDNLNMTHYRAIIAGAFKLFLTGSQPNNPILQMATELHYWPGKRSGLPRGAEIVSAMSNLVGDNSLLCPTYAWGDEATAMPNVYAYYYTHRSLDEARPEWMGVHHGAEVPFMLGNMLNPEFGFSHENGLISIILMTYWSNFIKYGDPNGIDSGVAAKYNLTLRNWPPYREDNCQSQVFEINYSKQVYGAGVAAICDLKARDCYFWDKFYRQLIDVLPTEGKRRAAVVKSALLSPTYNRHRSSSTTEK